MQTDGQNLQHAPIGMDEDDPNCENGFRPSTRNQRVSTSDASAPKAHQLASAEPRHGHKGWFPATGASEGPVRDPRPAQYYGARNGHPKEDSAGAVKPKRGHLESGGVCICNGATPLTSGKRLKEGAGRRPRTDAKSPGEPLHQHVQHVSFEDQLQISIGLAASPLKGASAWFACGECRMDEDEEEEEEEENEEEEEEEDGGG